MSSNRVRAKNSPLRLTVASPTRAGDVVVLGSLAGVAVTSWDAYDGKATVDLEGVYRLSVRGINGGGNIAVAAGDALYFTQGDTPPLSRKPTGIFFGYALDVVVSGATTTINVRVG